MSGIVVGVDGSRGSELALRFAIEEASLRREPLRIVCAWEPPAIDYAGAAFVPSGEYHRQARLHAEQVVEAALADARAALPEIDVSGAAIEGHPTGVLVEAADGATLLVVGSRGRGGFASVILGSIGQGIAHHARCPVTIVRQPAAET